MHIRKKAEYILSYKHHGPNFRPCIAILELKSDLHLQLTNAKFGNLFDMIQKV